MRKEQFNISIKGCLKQPFIAYANIWQILVICLIIVHFVTLSTFMLARVAALHTPTYDHGLFTQMFHYMLRTGLPLTTLERDMLLSHFKVHMSPIYYFYLPFFKLWPSGACLELLQIVTVLLALIPLAKLLKNELKLNRNWRYTLYLLYVYAPAITGSNFYDLHENCFLPLCLFSLILANWRKKQWHVLLWTCLTLAIKEDAIIYVGSLGIYFCLRSFAYYFTQNTVDKSILMRIKRSFWNFFDQEKIYFCIQIILPLIYFSWALFYLNHFGQGAMTNRFANLLLPGQKGLLAILANFILHPYFIFGQILTADKLRYLLTILLALGILPLLQPHLYNYVLLLPLLLLNLLSNYQYQHSLIFQYNYGSSTLLIYLTALALLSLQTKLKQLAPEKVKKLKYYAQTPLLVAVIVSLVVTTVLLRKISYSWRDYRQTETEINNVKIQLDLIPRDKRLLADTFLTTYLADAPELYDLSYHFAKQADPTIDYVIAYRHAHREQEVLNSYRKQGYLEIRELSSDKLIVLKRNA